MSLDFVIALVCWKENWRNKSHFTTCLPDCASLHSSPVRIVLCLRTKSPCSQVIPWSPSAWNFIFTMFLNSPKIGRVCFISSLESYRVQQSWPHSWAPAFALRQCAWCLGGLSAKAKDVGMVRLRWRSCSFVALRIPFAGFAMDGEFLRTRRTGRALRLCPCLAKWAGCKRLHSLSFSLKAALKLGYPLSGILRQLIITVCLEEGLDVGPSLQGIPGVGLQPCFPAAEEVGPSELTPVQSELLFQFNFNKTKAVLQFGLYDTKFLLTMSWERLATQ